MSEREILTERPVWWPAYLPDPAELARRQRAYLQQRTIQQHLAGLKRASREAEAETDEEDEG